MTEDDVLEQLDAGWGAGAFDVQPIDSHYRAADNRLTVFRSDARWVLLFEQVVYNVGEDAFERRLFAHGNALDAEGEGEWRCGVWDGRPFAFDPEVTALDPIARTPRPDRARFCVWVHGERLLFEPSESDYEVAGIRFGDGRTGPGSLKPEEALRFLCHHLRHPFFAPEDHLRCRIDEWQEHDWPPRGGNSMAHRLTLFLQTRHWQHPRWPDDGERELPSRTEGMRVLARAIAGGDLIGWDALDPALVNSNAETVGGS